MATSSFAQQLRKAVVSDAVAKYELEMAITDRGEVPDAGFFLMRIVLTDDPKQDELERVAGVGDLFEWEIDRPTALRNGQDFYRTSVVTKVYEDIQEAITAKDFLAEQVNTLVDDYITYDTQFEANPTPEIFEFPEPSVGVLTPLIEDYVAKTEEVEAQQEFLTEKTADCADLDAAYQVALQVRDDQQAALDALKRTQTSINAALSAMQAFKTVSENLTGDVVSALEAWALNRGSMSPAPEVQDMDDELLSDPPGPAGTLYSGYYDEYAPAKITFDTAIQVAIAESSEIGTRVAAQTTARDDAQNEVNQALSDKETCAQEEATISSVLATLQQEQAQLLSDIVALCPNYTPP